MLYQPGQFVPSSAVHQLTSVTPTRSGTRELGLPDDAHIPSVLPVAAGRTVFGIRPLVGHTVATATGAVRGAASRVGDAIGAAMAASSMTRNPSRYAHERIKLQQALAKYPLPTPYASPGTRATVSHVFALPQAVPAPVASSASTWNEAYLTGMEHKESLSSALSDFHKPSSSAGAAYIQIDDGQPTTTAAIGLSQPPPLVRQNLLNQADIPLLPKTVHGGHSSPASPAFPPADPRELLAPVANLPAVSDSSIAANVRHHTEASGLSAVARPQAALLAPGLASFAAQAFQQAVSGIPSNSLPRHPISFYDALSLAEKVVVPSIEAIAKVAPALPLAREAEKLRGKLSNKTDEPAPDLNAPPAQESPSTKIERRPRLYIP